MRRRYRVAFLCSSITSVYEGEDEEITNETDYVNSVSDEVKQRVFEMRKDSAIYRKLANSIAPSVYGHVGGVLCDVLYQCDVVCVMSDVLFFINVMSDVMTVM